MDDLARKAPLDSDPAVAGDPHFRFYAGAPVIDPDGFAVGALCVIDYEPRTLDIDQERALLALAALASDAGLVCVRSNRQLRWALEALNRRKSFGEHASLERSLHRCLSTALGRCELATPTFAHGSRTVDIDSYLDAVSGCLSAPQRCSQH